MSAATTAPPARTDTRCSRHRDRDAAWRCDGCRRTFCDPCMREKVPGRVRTESCPECRGFCRSIADETRAAEPRTLAAMIPDAAAYPLRGHGALLLVLGGLFLGFVSLLGQSPRMRFAFFFAIFGAGYLCAYMFRIVEASASGNRKLPEWPEFANFWDSICVPFFQMAAPTILCLLPAGLPFLVLGWNEQAFAVAIAMAIVCSFYVPMSILAIAVNDSIAGMHPSNVIPAIIAVLPRYAAIWLLLALIGGASYILQCALERWVPYVGYLIHMEVSLYLIAVEMRLLGLLYRADSARLNLV